MEIRPSTLDRSARIGDESAAEFARLMRSRGWKVRESTPEQDRLQHIDFICERGASHYLIDVKGRKASSDTHILIELRGITGRAGSLFGAGYLAFHTKNEFLLVARAALFPVVKNMLGFSVSFKGGFSISLTEKWTTAQPAVAPHIYRRPDRPLEMVTFLPVENVRALAVPF